MFNSLFIASYTFDLNEALGGEHITKGNLIPSYLLTSFPRTLPAVFRSKAPKHTSHQTTTFTSSSVIHQICLQFKKWYARTGFEQWGSTKACTNSISFLYCTLHISLKMKDHYSPNSVVQAHMLAQNVLWKRERLLLLLNILPQSSQEHLQPPTLHRKKAPVIQAEKKKIIIFCHLVFHSYINFHLFPWIWMH